MEERELTPTKLFANYLIEQVFKKLVKIIFLENQPSHAIKPLRETINLLKEWENQADLSFELIKLDDEVAYLERCKGEATYERVRKIFCELTSFIHEKIFKFEELHAT